MPVRVAIFVCVFLHGFFLVYDSAIWNSPSFFSFSSAKLCHSKKKKRKKRATKRKKFLSFIEPKFEKLRADPRSSVEMRGRRAAGGCLAIQRNMKPLYANLCDFDFFLCLFLLTISPLSLFSFLNSNWVNRIC